MTNREAIEYIERECHTCKGFYAPENECIAVPQDCFKSKRLAISALQEREERERGDEMTYKDVIDELKIAYDENGTPYMLEAFGSEAEHINRLLSAEFQGRLIELPCRCQDCVHSVPLDNNCEINTSAYLHCNMSRGEETRNVWHKYKKYYKDYSIVERDGFCDRAEAEKALKESNK